MDKKVRVLFILFFGMLMNIAIGYVLVGLFYLVEYKIQGLTMYQDFLSQPGTALSMLILGEPEGGEVWEKIRRVYWNPWLQLAFWAYVLYSAVRVGFGFGLKSSKKEASDYGSHGTARWATKREIMRRFTGDEKGIILGKFKGKPLIHPIKSPLNQFVVVFGGSGSGKSTGLVIPNILHTSKHLGESIVVTDTKGELYNATAATLRSRGYDVWVLNLLDPRRSMRYNPLDFVQETKDAASLATTIIKNTTNPNARDAGDFWERAEHALLTALILYVKETCAPEEQHLASVLEIGLSIGDNPEAMDALFKRLPRHSAARTAYRIFDQSEDRTRSSILTGFGNRLRLWAEPEIQRLTAKTDIDLEQLGEPGRKIALYILTPSYDSTFDMIPAMVVDQAFQQLYRKAERMPGNRLATPVRLFLDELANIAPISELRRKVATMRGYGISAFLIFQSKSQFENRYGKEVAAEVIDSCDTRLLLGTNDPGTQEYFSKLLGETTILIESQSENKGGKSESTGRSRSYTHRKLMTPDEVGRLDPDDLIIFQRGQFPVLARKNYMFEWPDWNQYPQDHWANLPERADEPISIFEPEIEKKEEVVLGKEVFEAESLPN